MEQVRAHWRRLYATYMNADAIIADLESCARHLTDGDKWEPNPIADGLKPMEMAEELDDDSGEPSAHGPYTRYSLQTVEEVPWKPESGDSAPIHEGNRTVHLPDVRSFGRLERDKWLAVKNLEESAELVEACKQYLKACDPTDPSGIGREFDDHANCLACYGVNVGGELGDDRDKAKAGRNVLAARANHPGQSLADLYDPDYMPTDLRAAHRELDKVADVAFGARKWLKDDDDARLQVLFKSYTHMTGSSEV